MFEDTVGGLDPILGDVETDLRSCSSHHPSGTSRYWTTRLTLSTRVFEARRVEERMADLIMDTKSFRQDEVKRLLERRGCAGLSVLWSVSFSRPSVSLACGIEPDVDCRASYDLKFRGQFLQEFPRVRQGGRHRVRVTFDPSSRSTTRRSSSSRSGMSSSTRIVDRVRSRAFGGTTAHRIVATDDTRRRSGWFFTFVLEFEGVTRSKELLPVLSSTRPADPSPTWRHGCLSESSHPDARGRSPRKRRARASPTMSSNERRRRRSTALWTPGVN